MRVVHKFPLDDLGDIVVDLCNPIIRHVGEDLVGFHDMPCVWIERDPYGEPTHRVTFRFVGTGHDVPDGWLFVGTAVLKSAGLVWHVYQTRSAL